ELFIERAAGERAGVEQVAERLRQPRAIEREGFVAGEPQPFDVGERGIGAEGEASGGGGIEAGFEQQHIAVLREALCLDRFGEAVERAHWLLERGLRREHRAAATLPFEDTG